MSNLTNLQSAELFAELTDEQLETVVGGTYGSGGLISAPLVNLDNSNGNIQGQGIGGQLNQSPVNLDLLNRVTGLLGL